MMADEREQIRKFCSGDAGAYEAFYAAYGPRIYRFCHRLCANTSDAEDLTQEIFVAAFQSRRNFQGRASLTTWIYRIALYRCRSRLADRSNRSVPLTDDGTDSAPTVDPVPSALDRLALEHAIATLPIALRETFLLVKAEGLTCREAAGVLEIPLGTVKYRIHEATGRLRKLLTAEMGAEPSHVPQEVAVGEVAHEM